MNKIMRVGLGGMIAGNLICSIGCLSMGVFDDSKAKLHQKKAGQMDRDNRAIKGVAMGNDRTGYDGFGIGVDVSNWEALSFQPGKQFLAAIGDVAIGAAGVGVATGKLIPGSSDSGKEVKLDSKGGNIYFTQGNNNSADFSNHDNGNNNP